jgi:COP9 signalosome complex subunit 1
VSWTLKSQRTTAGSPVNDFLFCAVQYSSAQYTGRTRIDRLLFLASHSPSLRIACSTAAIALIKSSTTDVTLYNRALLIRNTSAEAGQPLLAKEQRMSADGSWCEKSQKSNQNELEKLDLELRHYQNNLIKESVRVRRAHLLYVMKGGRYTS